MKAIYNGWRQRELHLKVKDHKVRFSSYKYQSSYQVRLWGIYCCFGCHSCELFATYWTILQLSFLQSFSIWQANILLYLRKLEEPSADKYNEKKKDNWIVSYIHILVLRRILYLSTVHLVRNYGYSNKRELQNSLL